MKKIVCVLLFICTMTLCLTSCLKCEMCGGDKEVRCSECFGKGKEVCEKCEGDGDCVDSDCINGIRTVSELCSKCVAGTITNPITWQQFTCRTCDGSGVIIGKEECRKCNGTGKCYQCKGSGIKENAGTCANCDGTGRVACPECAE